MPKNDYSFSFPNPSQADVAGLLCASKGLSPELVLSAYHQGIFPWYNDGEPVLWWTPDPRMVLFPDEIHISKSMRKLFRDNAFQVRHNTQFLEVMLACKRIDRDGQHGTWITNEMVKTYVELHKRGFAESVEVFQNGKLVGGLYGVNLKDQKIFCGESMFSKVSNASKVALIALSRKLQEQKYKLIDCQVYTEHLASMGAREIRREEFLNYLKIEN
ncbi:MAG: leucyl/phenylalanyl-tRNA--protein transferase [Leeuwenhoekiella sp.]